MNNPSYQNQKFRLLIDPEACSGQRNMAIDEMLLETVSEKEEPVFRLYQWSEPTISLGYFQKISQATIESRFENLPHVRRLSGGGAILHHHELTYSFVVPSSHPLTKVPSAIYSLIHRIIIKSLKEFEIETGLRCEEEKELNERFLCFGRGDANDIIFGSQKIAGSAQRRRQGNVLQHGSLLLRVSEHAPEFPGLEELSKITLPLKAFKRSLIGKLSESLNREGMLSSLDREEETQVQKLMEEKYQFLNWER